MQYESAFNSTLHDLEYETTRSRAESNKEDDNSLDYSIYKDNKSNSELLDKNLNIYLQTIHFDNKKLQEDFWKNKYYYYICFFTLSFVQTSIMYNCRFNFIYVSIKINCKETFSQYDLILYSLTAFVIWGNCWILRFKLSFKTRYFMALGMSGLGLLSNQIANIIGWQTNYIDQEYAIQSFLVFGSCFMMMGVSLKTCLVFTQAMHLPPYFFTFWRLGQAFIQLSLQPGLRVFHNYYEYLGDLGIISNILIQLGWIALLLASALSFNYLNKKRDQYGNVYDNLEIVVFNKANIKSISKRIKWPQIFSYIFFLMKAYNYSIFFGVLFNYYKLKNHIVVGYPGREDLVHLYDDIMPSIVIIFASPLIGILPFLYITLTKRRCKNLLIITSLLSLSLNLIVLLSGVQDKRTEDIEFYRSIYVLIAALQNQSLQSGLEYCSWFLIFNTKRIVRDEKEIAVNLFVLIRFFADCSM